MDFLRQYPTFFINVMLVNIGFYMLMIMVIGPFVDTSLVLLKRLLLATCIMTLTTFVWTQMGIGVAQIVLFIGFGWAFVVAPELKRMFRRRYPAQTS